MLERMALLQGNLKVTPQDAFVEIKQTLIVGLCSLTISREAQNSATAALSGLAARRNATSKEQDARLRLKHKNLLSRGSLAMKLLLFLLAVGILLSFALKLEDV